jgi:hypothetical protein
VYLATVPPTNFKKTAKFLTCRCCLTALLQDTDGQLIWRYVMPQGETASSAPQGGGDGAYAPLQGPSAVVAVVGSAHVRGMCNAWKDSLATPGKVEELLSV